MHGPKRNPGAGPRHGFPVSDPGADFDPDNVGADPVRATLREPVLIGYAISRDDYLHRLSIAIAQRVAVTGVQPLGTGHADCLRLVRRRALLRHFDYRVRIGGLGGDRVASAVAGRRLGRATAASQVNWAVML